MRRLCVFCLFLVPFMGCFGSNSPTEPDGRLPFTTVTAAKVSGSTGPQLQTVVRDAATWSRTWSELWAGRPPAEPAIDFRREMVAVVTASEICFGGVEIESIERSGGELVVRYADAAPTLCLCAQAELAFHAVRLARTGGTVSFVARVTPPLCPT